MTRSALRKTIYVAAIVVLLFPLYLLSQPATTESPGGWIAQERSASGMSQADLGKIDPTSASMKLATFGLHGVAANILWSRAIEYKDWEDYTRFDAALQQITYLQPHFVAVWDFQGHNVAFNISVEFDDYRDRYHYVIQGFNLLKKGISYNPKSPKLPRVLAHYTGFKIGRSDEKHLYRPLYYNDTDYHAPPPEVNWLLGTRYEGRPQNLRDNWQVSKWWYRQAENLIDSNEITYGMISPFVLHSEAPRAQMQYAEALEEEGKFDKDPKQEWAQAGAEWRAFGRRSLPTTRGYSIRLSDLEKYRKLSEERYQEFSEIEPGLRDRIKQKVLADLTPAERAARDKPANKRSNEEKKLAYEVESRLRIRPATVVEAMKQENRDRGYQLAENYLDADNRYRLIQRYNETVNFDYWQLRCDIEQSDDMIAARKAIYDARQAYQRSDLPASLHHFEEGIAVWKKVIDQFPVLLDENLLLGDIMDIVNAYREVLAQTRADGSRDLPPDFPLQEVVDRWKKIEGGAL